MHESLRQFTSRSPLSDLGVNRFSLRGTYFGIYETIILKSRGRVMTDTGSVDRQCPGDDWESLMRAANRGDKTAYARFLNAVAPVLRGIIAARGRHLDPGHREDILQEVLLAIHLKRHTWREDAPLRPWLYALTRHKIIDAFRARGQRIAVDVDAYAEVLPAPPERDPTEAGDMERLIGRLDPRAAAIVRAIGLQGLSFAEAGGRLSMTEGAVRVALHRALQRLSELRRSMIE